MILAFLLSLSCVMHASAHCMVCVCGNLIASMVHITYTTFEYCQIYVTHLWMACLFVCLSKSEFLLEFEFVTIEPSSQKKRKKEFVMVVEHKRSSSYFCSKRFSFFSSFIFILSVLFFCVFCYR